MRNFILISIAIFFGLNSCKQGTINGVIINYSDSTLSKQILNLSEKIKKEPKNHEYYYLRANEWTKSNRNEEAMIDISAALILDKENAVYMYKKADLMMAKDSVDIQSAAELLEKAIKTAPNFEDAIFLLGKIKLARQEYESALAKFDELILIDPNNAKAHFYKGLAFKENNFLDKAEEMFFKSKEIDNNYYDAYMQLGIIYEKKDPKLARGFYNNAIRINPDSDEANYALGMINQQQNQYKDAYQFYKQALTLNPGHRFAAYSSAFIDVKFENYEKALSTLDKIILLDPNYTNAMNLRAFTYEKMNDKAMAKSNYKKVLEINPKDSLANIGLKLLN